MALFQWDWGNPFKRRRLGHRLVRWKTVRRHTKMAAGEPGSEALGKNTSTDTLFSDF